MKLYQTLNRLDPYLHAPEGDVRVAEGGADDPHADLMCPRRRHLHLLHLQRLPRRLAHRRYATITVQRALSIQLQARKQERRKRGKAGAHVPLHLMGFATLCSIAAASRSDEATALGRSLARGASAMR